MDYTLLKIMLGTSLVATTSSILGTFTFLRKQSLIGDTLAHATFPGICIAFMFLGAHPLSIIFGGTISALLGAYGFYAILHMTHLKKDASLGIILSAFFGAGTYLLSIIICFGIIIFIASHWYQLKTTTFDEQFAQSINIHTHRLNIIFLCLLAITITLSLYMVGIILMSSLLIAPAIAARQWTHHLKNMIMIASGISISASCLGTYMSSLAPHLATGPLIIIILSIQTFFSILFGTHGYLAKKIRYLRLVYNIQEQAMLKNFLLFNESATDPYKAHDLTALKVIGKKSTFAILNRLAKKGFIVQTQKNFWALTQTGYTKALFLKKQEI
ncbi:metal ABC transporter permease [bacterium]|nr:metal ABC transporter permease [bacterium]